MSHLEIFSRPQVIENSRQYLLLRTDSLQKTVFVCPWFIQSVASLLKLYHPLSMLIVGWVEAAELSFLLFLLLYGLVFQRNASYIWGLSFPQPWKMKGWAHYWSQCKRGSQVETRRTRSCLKIKSALKLNGCYLVQALIGPDSWEVFVGGVCLWGGDFF